MTQQQLIEKFVRNPRSMDKGANSLAVRYSLTRDQVIQAKQIAKDQILNPIVKETTEEVITIPPMDKPILNKEKVSENGDREVELLFDRPMTREEIEEHYGIDNISTTLSTYWNKGTASGKYLVSAFIKCHHNNFYSAEELAKKLKSILSGTEPVKVKKALNPKEKICVVYLSDEHVGALNHADDVHGNFYSTEIYIGRLEQVVKELLDLDQTYEKLYIINLGDEADSQLDGMTTRKGHTLPSEDGKSQFDAYVKGRRILFESIFSSGVASEYEVINCNDSNHSGNHLSYIWNSAVALWLEGRYPEVKVQNVTKFIDSFEYGKHVIAYCHGKDSKDMIRNWPLQINDKIDGWLMQWFDDKGYSPTKNWLHLRKGDLHNMNYSTGKFGDYISMPSVYGSSSWIGINFGKSRPGAYLEILSKNSPSISAKYIWF